MSFFTDCISGSSAIEQDPAGAVAAHVERLRTAAATNEFLDLAQAERLGKRCLDLLGQIGPETFDGYRNLILAAVYYFILDEDAESDSESIPGLEHDEQVTAAVKRVVSRNE